MAQQHFCFSQLKYLFVVNGKAIHPKVSKLTGVLLHIVVFLALPVSFFLISNIVLGSGLGGQVTAIN